MGDDNGNNNGGGGLEQPGAGNPTPRAQFFSLVMHKIVEIPGIGPRLMIAMQLQGQGGVPLSHLMEIPGEVAPGFVQSLQKLIDEFPQYTTELGKTSEAKVLSADEIKQLAEAQKPTGLVDPGGKPLKIVKH